MLEELVEENRKRALMQLRKHSFIASVEVLCGKNKEQAPLAAYFSALSGGVATGYALEDNFDKLIAPTFEQPSRNTIIAYEASKHIVDGLKAASNVQLNGQRIPLDVTQPRPTDAMLLQFMDKYNEMAMRSFIRNEQRLFNFTVEYFYGVQRELATTLPEYTYRQGGYVESPTPVQDTVITIDKENERRTVFADVVGMEEQKKAFTIGAINEFRKRELKKKLIREGAKVQQYMNFILYGPGGTGKSYFAEAAAGEIGLPVIRRVGADFEQEYHGRGKNMLLETYEEAAKHLEGAVVIIDEADPIVYSKGTRGLELNLSITSQYYSILNSPWTKENIVTIHTTNHLEKYDRTLLTRFPFENRLYFGPIADKMKEKMLSYHLDKFNHDPFGETDLAEMVRLMGQRSIRNISQVAVGGYRLALDRDHEKVSKQDVLDQIARSAQQEGGDTQ